MKHRKYTWVTTVVLLLSLATYRFASASANWFVVETRVNDPACEDLGGCAWARFENPDGREYEACCIEEDCGGVIPSIGQEYKEDFSGDGIILVPTGADKPPGLQRFKVIEEEPPASPPTDTPTPTKTPTPTATDTPSPPPTDTPTPTNTPTPTPTDTPVPPTDTPAPPPTRVAPPGFGFGPDTVADIQPRYASTTNEGRFPLVGVVVVAFGLAVLAARIRRR
mgnify:CR=1 FL=1